MVGERDGFDLPRRIGPFGMAESELRQRCFCTRELSSADEQGKAACWRDQASGYGEAGFEAFDGAECHDVKPSTDEGFGASIQYIDVHQCKGAGEFAEEDRFLMIGFNERQ